MMTFNIQTIWTCLQKKKKNNANLVTSWRRVYNFQFLMDVINEHYFIIPLINYVRESEKFNIKLKKSETSSLPKCYVISEQPLQYCQFNNKIRICPWIISCRSPAQVSRKQNSTQNNRNNEEQIHLEVIIEKKNFSHEGKGTREKIPFSCFSAQYFQPSDNQ